MRGGYNDNPNVSSFLHRCNSLCVQGSAALKPLKGNCKQGRETTPLSVDSTPIAKLRRSHSKSTECDLSTPEYLHTSCMHYLKI